MDKNSYQELWEIFLFIRTYWKSDDDVSPDQFTRIIDYKISLDSAYIDYYEQAITEFNNLYDQFGDKQKALTELYKENQYPDPKIPDVADYVLSQFMMINVAFGGFKALGYQNYRGWMGGGNYEQTPPPYRVYNDGGNL